MEWAAFGRPIRFLYRPDCNDRAGSCSSAFSVRWPQTLVDRGAPDRISVQGRFLRSRPIRDLAARLGVSGVTHPFSTVLMVTKGTGPMPYCYQYQCPGLERWRTRWSYGLGYGRKELGP